MNFKALIGIIAIALTSGAFVIHSQHDVEASQGWKDSVESVKSSKAAGTQHPPR